MLVFVKTRLLQTRKKARTYAKKKRAAGFKTISWSKKVRGKWLVGVYEVR